VEILNRIAAYFTPGPRVMSVADLPPFEASLYSEFTGNKFLGGFGETKSLCLDYATLRERSAMLFNENLYARGLLRRLVTNEINTGLTLEAAPQEQLLGLAEGSLNEWAETIENRFGLWAYSANLCDVKGNDSFAAIQRNIRMEALISGDCLVIMHISAKYMLPQVQIIAGDLIDTPYPMPIVGAGEKITHGVHTDQAGKHLGFYVRQEGGKWGYVEARGKKTGRKTAWLVYGTERRVDDVRGTPMLSLILQSLKEVDRYRDSTQRKAVINSMIAMFIKKTADKMSSLPLTGAALRKESTNIDANAPKRNFSMASHTPGIVFEELQTGEEPVVHSTSGTDVNFGAFEAAMISAIAWANEMPAEILTLAFQSNYSASQAAINEFKIYLNKFRSEFSEVTCQPIYEEWLISEILLGKIRAPELLDAWRDPKKYDIYLAWVWADWSGAIKPSTGLDKQVRGYEVLVDRGWITNARASRELTGTKFSHNIKQMRRENEILIEAMRPLAEFKKEYGSQLPDPVRQQIDALTDELE